MSVRRHENRRYEQEDYAHRAGLMPAAHDHFETGTGFSVTPQGAIGFSRDVESKLEMMKLSTACANNASNAPVQTAAPAAKAVPSASTEIKSNRDAFQKMRITCQSIQPEARIVELHEGGSDAFRQSMTCGGEAQPTTKIVALRGGDDEDMQHSFTGAGQKSVGMTKGAAEHHHHHVNGAKEVHHHHYHTHPTHHVHPHQHLHHNATSSAFEVMPTGGPFGPGGVWDTCYTGGLFDAEDHEDSEMGDVFTGGKARYERNALAMIEVQAMAEDHGITGFQQADVKKAVNLCVMMAIHDSYAQFVRNGLFPITSKPSTVGLDVGIKKASPANVNAFKAMYQMKEVVRYANQYQKIQEMLDPILKDWLGKFVNCNKDETRSNYPGIVTFGAYRWWTKAQTDPVKPLPPVLKRMQENQKTFESLMNKYKTAVDYVSNNFKEYDPSKTPPEWQSFGVATLGKALKQLKRKLKAASRNAAIHNSHNHWEGKSVLELVNAVPEKKPATKKDPKGGMQRVLQKVGTNQQIAAALGFDDEDEELMGTGSGLCECGEHAIPVPMGEAFEGCNENMLHTGVKRGNARKADVQAFMRSSGLDKIEKQIDALSQRHGKPRGKGPGPKNHSQQHNYRATRNNVPVRTHITHEYGNQGRGGRNQYYREGFPDVEF